MFLSGPCASEAPDAIGPRRSNAESLTQQLNHCLVERFSSAALLTLESLGKIIGYVPNRQVSRNNLCAFIICIL
jgi:hypothetical protein